MGSYKKYSAKVVNKTPLEGFRGSDKMLLQDYQLGHESATEGNLV